MAGNPQLIMEAMDDFSCQHDFLISIGSDKSRVLADLLAEHKPKVIVELGGYLGYSAIFFADQLRKVHPNTSDVHVWSIEFDHKIADIATEIIKLSGLQDMVTVVKGPADESMRNLKNSGQLSNIDLLFIDHVEDLYEQDLKIALDELKLLKPGGLAVADNVVIPGAPKYRDFVRNRKDLKTVGVKGLIMPGEVYVGAARC
jgi:catechol O-methyltransferase